MDWITDQIAIGNFLDARSLQPGIDAILCIKEGCDCNCPEDIEVLAVPLHDGAGNNAQLMKRAIRFISDAVHSGRRVLVHCHAGRSRSVALVAAYLVTTDGLDKNTALRLIAARRQIYLSPGIEEIL